MGNTHALLRQGVDEAVALSTPGGNVPLTFAKLRHLAEQTINDLNAHGIGRGDRIAMVLSNGAECAAAFIAVCGAAAVAPLNPTYTTDEFRFYLTNLAALILIVMEDSTSPAIKEAEMLGMAIVRLRPLPDVGAGYFTLIFSSILDGQAGNYCRTTTNDLALLLHTSGTTSRPKLVPLTHGNLCASADNIRATLALTSADRGLNIMPLFHIHGLVAGILAPLSAGGEVSCTTGFNAIKFFDWMRDTRPTWYTAVPAMHQAILARAAQSIVVIDANPLRFLRSSSASISPRVIRDIEQVFGAPLIEAYGMTEAAHQMASNQLPPGERRPGSVGIAAGPDITVLGEGNQILAAGEVGEIAIRGDNVMSGYENNSLANAEAFTEQKWFRTGDEGILTIDGYLTITGRLKEIINRGGEKISPREIDDVVMEHPAIAQCLTFSVLDEYLGEDVAIAITLRENCVVSEQELRRFLSERIAPFKVPSRVVFLDEIPKGASGKLQRMGLARLLGLEKSPEPMSPRQFVRSETTNSASLEEKISRAWDDVFGEGSSGPGAHFFALGGDSLRMLRLWMNIEKFFEGHIDVEKFLADPTVENMLSIISDGTKSNIAELRHDADLISYEIHNRLLAFVETWPGSRPTRDRLVVALNETGGKPPIFLICQQGHEISSFAEAIGPSQPVFGFRSGHLAMHYTQSALENISLQYANNIEDLQPAGALALMGYCQGGAIMAKVVTHLIARGRQISQFVMIEWHSNDLDHEDYHSFIFAKNGGLADQNAEGAASNKTSAAWRINVPGEHSTLLSPPNVARVASLVTERLMRASSLFTIS